MLNYKFTNTDIDRYCQLSNKIIFFKSCKTLVEYVERYNTNNFKPTIIPLGKVLNENGINLYQITMDYITNHCNKKDLYALLELIVLGLKLDRISLDDEKTLETLEQLVKIDYNCTTKYVFKNRQTILDYLIQKDKKYESIKSIFSTEFTINYNKLEEYYSYNICINYPVISNNHNLQFTTVHKTLQKNINDFIEILKYQELNSNIYINYNTSFIGSKMSDLYSSKIIAYITLKDKKSCESVDNYCNFLIPELINSLITNQPYVEKVEIKSLLSHYLLHEKLEKEIPAKINTVNKMKL